MASASRVRSGASLFEMRRQRGSASCGGARWAWCSNPIDRTMLASTRAGGRLKSIFSASALSNSYGSPGAHRTVRDRRRRRRGPAPDLRVRWPDTVRAGSAGPTRVRHRRVLHGIAVVRREFERQLAAGEDLDLGQCELPGRRRLCCVFRMWSSSLHRLGIGSSSRESGS